MGQFRRLGVCGAVLGTALVFGIGWGCSATSQGAPWTAPGDDGGSGSGGRSSGGGGSGGSSGGHGSSGGGSGGTTSGGSSGGSSGGGSSGGTSSGTSSGTSGGSSGGTGSSGGSGGSSSGSPVSWPSDACKAMTANLLGQMSRQQKAGQMVLALNPTSGDQMNLQPGSVFVGGSDMPPTGNAPQDWANWTDGFFNISLGQPQGIPEIFGADSVHGVNHPSGTVIFPHNAGLASSRDAALVTQVGQITALESAALGMTMTYAPQASVAWDSRWGRFYESFSEDVNWAAEMVQAAVIGLQGPGGLGTGSPGIIACAKHWAGDGQGTAGTSHTGGVVDRSDIQIDLPTMEQYGFGAYLPAIASGLGCMMITDTTWNGQWVTSSHQMITDLLKGMYGFQGIAMTDWNAQAAAGGYDAVVNAGIDMLMQPSAWQDAVNAIASSPNIPDSRIDDAVTRILNVKCQAGLFNFKRDPSLLASVGSAEHRAVGRKAVAESLVVLQNNNNVLPLKKGSNIWVGGGGANSLAIQCGGWTINWQGAGDQTQGTTIAQAIGKVASPASNMANADAIVVVLGEAPHAETPGDSQTINTIPAADFTTLQQAHATGKPVVAIVLSGRPVQIADNLGNADAWIAGWLPGTEGDGVADILFGDVHPTGKLSHSWPKDDSQDNLMTCCNGNYQPLFPLGAGLTY